MVGTVQVGFLDFTEQAALTAVQNVQNVTEKPSDLLVNCQDGQQQIPHIFTGEVQKMFRWKCQFHDGGFSGKNK